jgi:hypothetical protein
MKTLKLWEAFDEEVFRCIAEEHSKGGIHSNGRDSKAYLNKSYPSKNGGPDVVVDISIDTFLPNSSDYSQLTIFKCAKCNTPITQGDLEQFHSQAEQIDFNNVKAVFVTDSAFQQPALAFAKDKGMGIIRYMQDHQISQNSPSWVRKGTNAEHTGALTNHDHRSSGQDFYGLYARIPHHTLLSMLKKLLN